MPSIRIPYVPSKSGFSRLTSTKTVVTFPHHASRYRDDLDRNRSDDTPILGGAGHFQQGAEKAPRPLFRQRRTSPAFFMDTSPAAVEMPVGQGDLYSRWNRISPSRDDEACQGRHAGMGVAMEGPGWKRRKAATAHDRGPEAQVVAIVRPSLSPTPSCLARSLRISSVALAGPVHTKWSLPRERAASAIPASPSGSAPARRTPRIRWHPALSATTRQCPRRCPRHPDGLADMGLLNNRAAIALFVILHLVHSALPVYYPGAVYVSNGNR